MDFLQVDVFTDEPYGGNPLAVFPEAAGLSRAQMQAIASEMNLSETTFVTGTERDAYSVRIFTPAEELPFAGHPTIGTAWVLKHLVRVSGQEFLQRSSGGVTSVYEEAGRLWFSRSGEAAGDLESTDPTATAAIAKALGVAPPALELEARELGRSGMLRPAFSNAGLRQLMVPMQSLNELANARLNPALIEELGTEGAYCFTATGAGRLRARGLWPGFGIVEDPATGSAAAALGLYLAERVGDIQLEVLQGVEMGRPSRIEVRARPGQVRVGGECRLVLRGRLEELPTAPGSQ